MKIINIMASKTSGGIEQAFLDYNEALVLKDHKVFAVYNKNGKIKNIVKVDNVPSLFFKPSFLLIPYFYLKLKKFNADIIILHSKKYLSLFSVVKNLLKIPLVLVCHNEKTKNLNKANYLFSITQYQKDIFVKKGFDEKKIFVIPNMISDIPPFVEFKNFSTPPIFGTLGRFDPMKGFIMLIEAAKIAKDKGLVYKLKIGGTAQKQYINEYEKMVDLIDKYSLNDYIELLGWIDDKTKFFQSIDVFILPSIYEPFGIVLLEAMKYSKPIISSLAEGPREIFGGTEAALTFEINDSETLAKNMIELVKNDEIAKKLAKNGYELVRKKYAIEEVANLLNDYI